MNVNDPCILTNSELISLSRFTEILSNVHNRVSSRKPSSISPQLNNNLGKGLIDKLIIHLPQSMTTEELTLRCKGMGYKVNMHYKRDKRYYMGIDCHSQTIDCFLGRPNNTECYKIIINPSKVKLWSMTELLLIKIFSKSVLESKIYRIDYTVDIFETYEKILEGLDIKYKRSTVEFIGGSIRTGLLIGVENDKISIYNKGNKEKANFPWTRIERQTTGKAIFIKKLGDLKHSAEQIITYNPLAIITLNNIHFISDQNLPEGQISKLNELKTLIKFEGYFLGKKKLSKNNNFQRDYGNLFTLTPYLIQPHEIFNNDISIFFKETIQ